VRLELRPTKNNRQLSRTSGYRRGGSGRTRTLAVRRYVTIVTNDIGSDVAKYGVMNQSVAYQ